MQHSYESIPVLQELHLDHLVINEGLRLAKKQWLALEKEAVVALSRLEQILFPLAAFVGGVHHIIEEEVLFPAIAGQAEFNQGGPHCTLFMQSYVASQPLQQARARLKEYDCQVNEDPKRLATILEMSKQGSFLSIPLEEHEAGHLLVEAIKSSFTKAHRDFTRYGYDVIFLVNDYLQLLGAHVKKEEECLFVVCKQILQSQGELKYDLKRLRQQQAARQNLATLLGFKL